MPSESPSVTESVQSPSRGSAPATLAATRAHLDEHRPALFSLLAAPATAGVAFAQRHAEIMDGLLIKLYLAASARVPAARGSSMVLAAVGGYGRQLLGCKSDLDVRFFTTGSAQKLQPFVDAMLYPLWDAGVSIGHQVVTLADAVHTAKSDLPTATALLDVRGLIGDQHLVRELSERAFAGPFSDARLPDFLAKLDQQADSRQVRFTDSVYLLEPDVKNGRGGLRDLDLASWAAGARFHTSDLRELEGLGIVSATQVSELLRAQDFLWAVRNHLHHRASRKHDRLTFGEQESIAVLMGYGDGAQTHSCVERFMSDYYRHARVITRLRDQIIGRAKRRPRRGRAREVDLGRGLYSGDEGVGLRELTGVERDPAIALRLYAAAVEADLPVAPQSRTAIALATADDGFCAALRADAQAGALFVGLVATCKPSRFRDGSILGELHEVGLLGAMIPELEALVGRVHHDLYHVYTVDVHSVAAVDHMRALSRGELAQTQPFASRLAAEVARPQTLLLATLLHDLGKAIGRQDHCARGADLARMILGRLGLAPEDIAHACELIRLHRVMYVAAAQRDLADPATVAELVRQTRGRQLLRDLYLLTIADRATTGPASLSPWQLGMLDALMRAGDALLSDHAGEDPARIAAVREQTKRAWNDAAHPNFIDEFMDGMPERYLLASSPAEIVAHAGVALASQAQPVVAQLVPSRHADVAELCVVSAVTADRPGLLAAITAAISGNRLEIAAAQIHSRPLPDGGVQAVDIFWVRGAARGAAAAAERLPKLQRDLRAVIAGQVQAADFLAQPTAAVWGGRPIPAVSTQIAIDHGASHRHTVIEVVTADRHGLLFTLAHALAQLGVSIHVAKINTEGSAVIDVFYVTEADGKKLEPGARSKQVCASLQAALDALAATQH